MESWSSLPCSQNPPLVPHLSQTNPIHALHTVFVRSILILFLPVHLVLQAASFLHIFEPNSVSALLNVQVLWQGTVTTVKKFSALWPLFFYTDPPRLRKILHVTRK